MIEQAIDKSTASNDKIVLTADAINSHEGTTECSYSKVTTTLLHTMSLQCPYCGSYRPPTTSVNRFWQYFCCFLICLILFPLMWLPFTQSRLRIIEYECPECLNMRAADDRLLKRIKNGSGGSSPL